MKQKKPKIEYDKKNKVLSIIVKNEKSADSDIQGNAVIDYDKKGEMVRVSFYEFSFDDFKKEEKNIREFTRKSKMLAIA